MSPRYTIVAYDQAGEYAKTQVDAGRLVRFALVCYRDRYPGKTLVVYDGERDGRALTDEELEALEHGDH